MAAPTIIIQSPYRVDQTPFDEIGDNCHKKTALEHQRLTQQKSCKHYGWFLGITTKENTNEKLRDLLIQSHRIPEFYPWHASEETLMTSC